MSQQKQKNQKKKGGSLSQKRTSPPGRQPHVALVTATVKRSKNRGARRGGSMGRPIQPSSTTVELTFIGRQTMTTTTGFWGYPLRTNAAFAPDANGSATYQTTPGFASQAALFSMYRVTKYKFRAQYGAITQNQVFQVFALNSNSALGTSAGGSSVDLTQYTALRPGFNKQKMLTGGNSGYSVVTLSGAHKVSSVYGDSPFTDPGFKSATNTVPSILTYLVLGFACTVANSEIDVEFEIKMKVEFLDYIDTLTSLGMDGRPLCFSRARKEFLCAACTRLEQPWEGDHLNQPWQRCVCGKTSICRNCDTEIPCGNWFRCENCSRPADPVIPIHPREVPATSTQLSVALEQPYGSWIASRQRKAISMASQPQPSSEAGVGVGGLPLSPSAPVFQPSSPVIRFRSHGPRDMTELSDEDYLAQEDKVAWLKSLLAKQ